jgi:hypothetical protein
MLDGKKITVTSDGRKGRAERPTQNLKRRKISAKVSPAWLQREKRPRGGAFGSALKGDGLMECL